MYASAELPKYNIIFTLWLGRGLWILYLFTPRLGRAAKILYYIHPTPRPRSENIILYSVYASAELRKIFCLIQWMAESNSSNNASALWSSLRILYLTLINLESWFKNFKSLPCTLISAFGRLFRLYRVAGTRALTGAYFGAFRRIFKVVSWHDLFFFLTTIISLFFALSPPFPFLFGLVLHMSSPLAGLEVCCHGHTSGSASGWWLLLCE